jgi:Cu/Ag efflux protein CusF
VHKRATDWAAIFNSAVEARRMRITSSATTAAIVISATLCVVSARAQTPTMAPQGAMATIQNTETIVGIDKATREVTLKDAQGNLETYQAGPGVKRFDALKVGDQVTFTYKAAYAYSIAKPGETAPAMAASPTVSYAPGEKPGGAVSQVRTTIVTVQSINENKPSVTVKTQDGRVQELAVQDKRNLANLKPGDVVQITYAEAIIVTVK